MMHCYHDQEGEEAGAVTKQRPQGGALVVVVWAGEAAKMVATITDREAMVSISVVRPWLALKRPCTTGKIIQRITLGFLDLRVIEGFANSWFKMFSPSNG